MLFEQHSSAVYGFAYRMTGSKELAEDIAQEVFVGAIRASERYDSRRGSPRAFLLGITRYLVLKRWRDEGRWDPLEEDGAARQRARPASQETAVIVSQAVGSLPPLQREALILAEYEGLSLREIARLVDAEVGTVKARLHRAREGLRRALTPGDRDPQRGLP